MTIRSRLQISSLLYVAVALGIGLVLLMGMRNLQQELEKSSANHAVVTGLIDLTILVDDYLIHPERRSLRQWQAKYSEVGRFLRRRASLEIVEAETANRLIEDYEELNPLFSRLISVQTKIQPDEAQSNISVELRNRLMGMLGLKLQTMVSNARRLHRAGQASIDAYLFTSTWILMVFGAVTAFIILGNHLLTRSTVISPLTKLIKDTEIIGSGNLDHVVDIKTRDEMGNLGQAFNRMTQDLKKSYGALESEIRERTQAQDGLQRHRDHLEELVEERTNELKRTNEELQKEIEERKGAERALRETLARLNGLVDAVPDLVFFKDTEDRFLMANTAYEQFIGCIKHDIIGRTSSQLLPPDLAQQVREHDEEVRLRREPVRRLQEAISKDGKSKYWDTIRFPVINDQGEIMGVGAVARDVTELQRVQEVLQMRTDALGRANKELEAFSYSVSHDLRAPLRAIDGFSRIVSQKYSEFLDAKGQDYLKRVMDECQRMGQLIDDLLKLSRLTRTEMRYQEVNLSAMTKEILGKLQNEEPHRSAEFVISDDLLVNGDEGLLGMVLENLLNNAWKFTKNKPLARITVGKTEHEGECAYFVKDNGAGFKMAYVDKLFGAFQRLHSATEFPGSGVGLAIVQRIIHRHGGRVWAEGVQGQGATFCFTLSEGG